jgi:molybdenum cofactor cytidylyltransferase
VSAPLASSSDFSVGLVLLAAGFSRRMGKPKLLLPWGATSVLGHLLQQWQRLRAGQTAVVCGIGDAPMQAELDRLSFPMANRIMNPAPERGMFSSIQCAAGWPGWDAGVTHWAIALGDQPHLRPETLEAVLAFSAAHPQRVCQPRYAGHRRHPVVLPRSAFKDLAVSKTTSLKEFLDSRAAVYYEATDPGLAVDIDVPEDYERAIEMWKVNRSPT